MIRASLRFIVAGTQKAGTTALFEMLRKHPQLSPPRHKEIHFFDDESIDWRTPDYSRLHGSFDQDDSGQRFDVTPIYSFWPPSMPRIQAYNPEVKIIALFRDPVERAYSHWCMEFARGWEILRFEEAIREGRKRLARDKLHPDWRVYSYVERGFYTEQVRRILRHFPRDRCLFLNYTDLATDHMSVLWEISHFLGIEPFDCSPPVWANVRPKIEYPSRLELSDLEYLSNLFAKDVAAFSNLTGVNVDEWLTMTHGVSR